MKAISTSTRWLGLALACGTLTFAVTTQAGKPVKPPPPPPAPPYNHYLLGDLGAGSHAAGINADGLVIGAAPLPGADGSRPILVVPGMGTDGKLVWYSDANGDGRNDLMVNLGIPPGAASTDSCGSTAINDHGVILGNSSGTVNPWILAPQPAGLGLSWTTLDAEGINTQMMLLPVFTTPLPLVDMWGQEQALNNHGVVALVIGSENFPTAWWQRGFLLVPSRYEVSGGAVTVEYPAADANGDGINDCLISLGNGLNLNGYARPLLPAVINDQGDVAGSVWGGAGGSVDPERPFVLRPVTVITGGRSTLVWCKDDNADGLNDLAIYLPMSTGARAGWVTGINENGTLVGAVSDRYGTKAALWQVDWVTRTATFKSLGLVGGEKNSYATGVNASGQVAGTGVTTWSKPDYGASFTGWLWSQGTMSPLSALMSGLTATLNTAEGGINDPGMIAGSQLPTYPGISTAFIAVPVTQP